ncbi:uncharacterized protein LOC126812108 [Patella vulgata]|uniref:uncharacterized protein LOC126812108 n=1 Tax=Patella vulgata TaxID=6465 RepID=UPI00217F2E89|nr:uncharacterized protein LOC126812108 [Patella vulgata]XP_050394313.1 uncharacterized protein LOC126812108 [Patella vulgata]XP_050394314.1 uncharacterized protein LOC126812108 [Patella vulgata]
MADQKDAVYQQLQSKGFKVEVAVKANIFKHKDDFESSPCDKNPGHVGFIPFNEFGLEHLPVDARLDHIVQNIRKFGTRVVRLVVRDETGNKVKLYGTGHVYKLQGRYIIRTNSHVIRNETDLKNCVIEFNYNSRDRSEVIESRGKHLILTKNTDAARFTFQPVPQFIQDMDIMDRYLYQPVPCVTTSRYQVLCHLSSLPFLKEKCRIGLLLKEEPKQSDDLSTHVQFEDGTISKFVSYVVKFQPVPEKIQTLPAENTEFRHPVIQIKENGKCRTIKGEVVSIEGNHYLKLAEPLTQEQARGCKVLFSDGSCSEGTGLFFEKWNFEESQPLRYLKGNDLDRYHLFYRNFRFWTMFDPIPKDLQRYTDMVNAPPICDQRYLLVIGHPHGGPKMITVGKELSSGVEIVDDCYLDCIQYSCKTCPGSSGSPVVQLAECHPFTIAVNTHFMGRIRSVSEMVSGHTDQAYGDNINIGWNGKKWTDIMLKYQTD